MCLSDLVVLESLEIYEMQCTDQSFNIVDPNFNLFNIVSLIVRTLIEVEDDPKQIMEKVMK